MVGLAREGGGAAVSMGGPRRRGGGALPLPVRAYQCALLGRHMKLLLRRVTEGASRRRSRSGCWRTCGLVMEETEGERLGEWP